MDVHPHHLALLIIRRRTKALHRPNADQHEREHSEHRYQHARERQKAMRIGGFGERHGA